MTTLPPPAVLADLLPDEPAWVDLRGILLSGRCAVFAGEDPRLGFVARSWDFPFAAVAGRPDAGTVRRAVADAEQSGIIDAWAEWHVLVPPDAAPGVAAALPGWARREVVLHRLAGALPASSQPPAGSEVRLFPEGSAAGGVDLSHLPGELAQEMGLDYVASRPLAAASVDGRAVAFCYAPFVTETLWDVAVDTLAPYRRRGLAAACFKALAAHLAVGGRRPVWGAMAANVPSMRLAARLGFTPAAPLASFVRPKRP
jgi:GNAT superfamily N-acetyltransferase